MSDAIPTFPSSETSQANAATVTRLLNHYLQQHGIHVDAVYDACCLHLALRSANIPPPRMVIDYISRGIVGLQAVLPQQNEPLDRVRLYGYQGVQEQAVWVADFVPNLTGDRAATNGTEPPSVSLHIYDVATPTVESAVDSASSFDFSTGETAIAESSNPAKAPVANHVTSTASPKSSLQVQPVALPSGSATTAKTLSSDSLPTELSEPPLLLPASHGLKELPPKLMPAPTPSLAASDSPPSGDLREGISVPEHSLPRSPGADPVPPEQASLNAGVAIDLDAELAPLKTLQNQRYLAQLLLIALAIGGIVSFVYGGWYVPKQRQNLTDITLQTQNLDQQPVRTIEDLRRLVARLTELQNAFRQFSPLVPGVYEQAQTQRQLVTEQLAIVAERLVQEEAAVENLQQARRFAVEAQQILEGQTPTMETLRRALQKWQAAIYALDLIPVQQFVGREARQLTLQYKRQYDLVQRQLLIESEAEQLDEEQLNEADVEGGLDNTQNSTQDTTQADAGQTDETLDAGELDPDATP